MIDLTNKQKLALLQISLSFASVCMTGTAGAINTAGTSTIETWAGTSAGVGNNSTIPNATFGNAVVFVGPGTVKITNDGIANDASANVNTFALGAITNTSGTGNVTSTTGTANNLTVTIASLSINGAFNVANEFGSAHTNTTTVSGALAVTGITTVTAGTNANATSTLIFGDTSITGTSGFVLSDGTNGASAKLRFNGGVAHSVTGAINGLTSGKGTVETLGTGTGTTTTFNSAIGTTSIAAFVLNSTDAAAASTVNSNLSATAITLTEPANTATLTFGGSSTQTITGAILGSASDKGRVVVNGTNVAFASNVGVTKINAFTINAGKQATFASGLTLGASSVINNGTMVLNGKVTTSASTGTSAFELGGNAASTITMGASSYTGDVMLDASTVPTVVATNTVTVVPHANMLSGTVTVVRALTTVPAATKFTATGTNLMDYVFAKANSDKDITMTPTAKSTSTLASSLGITSVQANVVAPLLAAAQGDSTVTSAISSAVASTVGAQAIAIQSGPDSSGSLTSTVSQNTGTVMTIVSDRVNSARGGAGAVLSQIQSAGLSAGNEPNLSGIWVKPYAYMGDQRDIGGVAGYKNKTHGAMLGVDRLFLDKVRLGLSGGYSKANIHGGGVGKNQTDVTGYQASLYGDYSTDRYFVDGMLGYGTNEVNTSRRITFGGLNQVALGEYHAQQYFARVEGGKPYALAKNHVLTPIVGFDYSHLKSDPYTETEAGVLNLAVTPDAVDVGLVTMGVRYQHTQPLSRAFIHHVVRLGAGYDVIDDNGIATTKFASGTTSFRTEAPDISPIEGHAGLGVGYASADDVAHVTLDYDAEFREKFLGHTIRLEWRYNF